VCLIFELITFRISQIQLIRESKRIKEEKQKKITKTERETEQNRGG